MNCIGFSRQKRMMDMVSRKTIIVVFVMVLTLVSIPMIFFVRKGETSGMITLVVDGKEVDTENVMIEFSFTSHTIHNSREVEMSRVLRNGRFNFNRSEYGPYYIRFSLDPDLWGESGDKIYVEVRYFNTNARANKVFDIQVNVLTEREHTIYIKAEVGKAFVITDKLSIETSGTTISVIVPSP